MDIFTKKPYYTVRSFTTLAYTFKVMKLAASKEVHKEIKDGELVSSFAVFEKKYTQIE